MELWERGLELRRKGLKLGEIAVELDVPLNTVKSWSTRYWNKEKVATKSKKGCNLSNKKVATKQGAPKGNKNAVGNKGGTGIPPKHGGYSAVYWDTLDDDERQLIESTPQSEEEILINQIRLFDVRERRILKAINQYRHKDAAPLAVAAVSTNHTKRDFDNAADKALYEELKQEEVSSGKVKPGYDKNTHTSTEATYNIIQRLENELTRVQRAKTQCVQTLNRVLLAKGKTSATENTAIQTPLSHLTYEQLLKLASEDDYDE